MLKAILIPCITAAIGAAIIDAQAYFTALQTDPRAKFNWRLCLLRVGIGAATGALGGFAGKVNYSIES